MSPYFSYGFNSNGRQLLCVSHPWTSRPLSLRNGEQSCKGIREVRNVRGLTCLERLLEQAGSWLPVFFPPHFFPPPPSSSPLSHSPLCFLGFLLYPSILLGQHNNPGCTLKPQPGFNVGTMLRHQQPCWAAMLLPQWLSRPILS